MSSPEVFPASPSLVPDSERERKMTAISGRKCYERYGRFSPIGLLVKTLLESSRWYSQAVKLRWEAKKLYSEKITEKEHCIGRNMSSKQCVTTLNVKDIPSNRLLFRLVPSEHRTEETASSLLPTVQTQGLKVCNENGKTTFYPVGLLPTPMASDATTGAIIGKNDQFVTTRNGTPRKINQNGQSGSVGLARMVRLLPTPNALEADKYTKKYNPNSQMGTALTTMAINGMLPTPAARDYQPSVSPQALKRKTGNEDGCSVQPAGNVRRTSFAERWENFPTQSPVCSRDDGIFTGLDGIAFSKWRQESIKAYGNAIVPQVMYEIFLAIESIEKGK